MASKVVKNTKAKLTSENKQRVTPEVRVVEETVEIVKVKANYGETKIKMLKSLHNTHAKGGVFVCGKEYVLDGKLAKNFIDNGVAEKC